MSKGRIVWSDEDGDLRKKKENGGGSSPVNEESLVLEIRRLTTGKGRTIIELRNLPSNKKWNQALAKDIKKKLGVGGAFKSDYIEVHGELLDKVTKVLDDKQIKWKKTGG